MKYNQVDNFNFTQAMLAKTRRHYLWILMIALIACGFTTMPRAAGQTKANQSYGRGMEVPAGYDLLKTVEGTTQFRFIEEFTIPAGFFDNGSSRFSGVVKLKGAPIGSFRDQKTGDADTVIERTKPTSFSGFGQSTVPIEVVALSLESIRPINVRVGKEWQQWNVKFGLSPNRKSEGTLTLARRSERGGTLNSEFTVFGLITFTRTTDGAEKILDVGAMKLDAKSIEKITLRTVRAPWSQSADRVGVTGGFQAGVTTAGLSVGFNESSRIANHGVISVAF